ncbi:MAG: biotin--[acetyl-CoA-carboxylase] ligase [Candidatus Limnocylindrales bacterium]
MSTAGPFLSRLERFAQVESTQQVVRAWLADGLAEVAVAVADVQRAGRGRQGRRWDAPPGAGLLLTCGFRPRSVALQQAWRVAAAVSLAMADAAEAQGLPDGMVRLKWPNDLVADGSDGEPRKLAGVLGEVTSGGDGRIETCLVGIGVNADWAAADFPVDLARGMTSLRELARRPIERDALLDDFLARLEPRYTGLLGGAFDSAGWSTRQRTTGARVAVGEGDALIEGIGAGVEPNTGALLLEVDGVVRPIDSAEVVRCRVVVPHGL